MCDLVLEHFRGMVCLVGEGIYGSAFSLLRAQYEALVRGAWLAHVASDDEVTGFREDEGHEFPKLNQMLSQMEARSLDFAKLLAGIKLRNYKRMNDLTHGGQLQASVRISDGVIGQHIPDQDAADLLLMTAAMAASAAGMMLSLGDRGEPSRADSVQPLLDELIRQVRTWSGQGAANV